MAYKESFLEVVLKNTGATTLETSTVSESAIDSMSTKTASTLTLPEAPIELPMPQPYITFDIEYDRLLKTGPEATAAADSEEAPKITCIAAVTCEGLYTFWHGGYHEPSGSFSPHMSEAQIRHFVDFLWTYFQKGYVIVTWGGTAFDFKILFNEVTDPNYKRLIHFLARRHVDIPLTSAATSGMMMGLSAVSKAMGLGSKPYDSIQMPSLWTERNQEAVLRQVWADAALTSRVYMQIFANGEHFHSTIGRFRPYLEWVALSGKTRRFYAPYVHMSELNVRLLNVEECMAAPRPVTPFEPSPTMTVEACTRWLHIE
jgi:hypothetical protein